MNKLIVERVEVSTKSTSTIHIICIQFHLQNKAGVFAKIFHISNNAFQRKTKQQGIV